MEDKMLEVLFILITWAFYGAAIVFALSFIGAAIQVLIIEPFEKFQKSHFNWEERYKGIEKTGKDQ
jgi:hypothetical protein